MSLDPAAYHGLPGHVVRTLEPYSEADPAALLLHFLVYFGNAAGAGPHLVTDTVQPGRLNVVVVGEAAGRKGTANNAIKTLMEAAAPDWKGCITPGVSTSQALISLVDDDFASDRRMVLLETEFGRLLTQMKSFPALAEVLKQAFDGDQLKVRTKDRGGWLTATRAHISVIGHVVPDVLADRMKLTDVTSGFGNRLLFLSVARSKSLPRGGRLDPDRYDELVDQVADALEFVNELVFDGLDPISLRLYDYFGMQPQQELERTDAFLDRWDGLYEELNRRQLGAVGQLLQRGHTHVLRLAVVYALADRSKTVDLVHLEAAEAVWRYCAASAREVFGGLTDSRDLDKVLQELLRADGHELSRTDIAAVFNRAPTKNYGALIAKLVDEGWATHRREGPPKGSKGRPRDVYTLTGDALAALTEASK